MLKMEGCWKLIKKIIVKIRYKFKEKLKNVFLWIDFLHHLIVIKPNSICLFHTEPWHYNWDLESRKYFYREIIGRKNVIFINLKSQIMINIFIWYLGINKTKLNNGKFVEPEILFRSLWDKKIKSNLYFQSIEEYLNIYNNHKTKIKKNKNLYLNIQRVLSSNKIETLTIIQSGFIDWWLKCVAERYNKFIIIPEHLYGFIRSKKIDDDLFIKKFNEKRKFLQGTDNAELSIKNRIHGNYEKSSLSMYMNNLKDKKSEFTVNFQKKNIIFFMHVFTDTPNVNLNNHQDFLFIDHFHFIIDLITKLANSKTYNIYFKPHPDSARYEGDKKYFDFLRNYTENIDNIFFISSNYSINELNTLFKNSFISLTGRGSVSLECKYIGVRVFNYINNIYTKLYFAEFVKTPNDLIYKINKNFISKVKVKDIIEYEAFIIKSKLNSLYTFTKYSRHSKNNLVDILTRL